MWAVAIWAAVVVAIWAAVVIHGVAVAIHGVAVAIQVLVFRTVAVGTQAAKGGSNPGLQWGWQSQLQWWW